MLQYIKFFLNSLKPMKVVKDDLGLKYFYKPNFALERHVFRKGIFDEVLPILKIISKLDKKNVAFDIGANSGLISLPLSLNFNKVIAFEPDPENFKKLTRNIALNKKNNLLAYEKGVGEKNQVAKLNIQRSIDGDGCINNGLSSFEDKNNQYVKLEKMIEMVTIDSFCEKKGISDVNLIKIDTEGFEYYVLKGALKVLTKYHPVIFYEASHSIETRSGQPFLREKCFTLLQNLGYKQYLVGINSDTEIFLSDLQNLKMDVNILAI